MKMCDKYQCPYNIQSICEGNGITNGEMLMGVFPNYIYHVSNKFTYVFTSEKAYKKAKYFVRYSNKWWNKPYQKEEQNNE